MFEIIPQILSGRLPETTATPVELAEFINEYQRPLLNQALGEVANVIQAEFGAATSTEQSPDTEELSVPTAEAAEHLGAEVIDLEVYRERRDQQKPTAEADQKAHDIALAESKVNEAIMWARNRDAA